MGQTICISKSLYLVAPYSASLGMATEHSIQKGVESPGQGPIVYASAIRLESHSSDHIPVYDPARGGYVTGTGVQGDIVGNYNNYGNSGVGVNNTPQEIGTVAYGGALGAPYGNDPYSVTRNSRSVVHPPPGGLHVNISEVSAPYGNDPYSVKRL